MDLAKNVIFNQLQGSPMYSKSNSTSFFVKKNGRVDGLEQVKTPTLSLSFP